MAELLLVGRHARVSFAPSDPRSIIEGYRDVPDLFVAQFGAVVTEFDDVVASHLAAFESGLSSYYVIQPADAAPDEPAVAHIRVDWRLSEPGVVGVHGGSPDPCAEHRAVRREAWIMMNLALAELPTTLAMTTCCRTTNERARRFIAGTGFRPVRLTRSPRGESDTWHFVQPAAQLGERAEYRDVLAEMSSQGRLRPSRDEGAWGAHEPADSGCGSASLSELAIPPAWEAIHPEIARPWADWLIEHRSQAADFIGESLEPDVRPDDLVAGMRFNQRHGFDYFGHRDERGDPNGLLGVQRFPKSPSWWRLYGGPFHESASDLAVGDWLRWAAGQQLFERIEIRLQPRPALIDFWRSVGFVEETIESTRPSDAPRTFSLLNSDLASASP